VSRSFGGTVEIDAVRAVDGTQEFVKGKVIELEGRRVAEREPSTRVPLCFVFRLVLRDASLFYVSRQNLDLTDSVEKSYQTCM